MQARWGERLMDPLRLAEGGAHIDYFLSGRWGERSLDDAYNQREAERQLERAAPLLAQLATELFPDESESIFHGASHPEHRLRVRKLEQLTPTDSPRDGTNFLKCLRLMVAAVDDGGDESCSPVFSVVLGVHTFRTGGVVFVAAPTALQCCAGLHETLAAGKERSGWAAAAGGAAPAGSGEAAQSGWQRGEKKLDQEENPRQPPAPPATAAASPFTEEGLTRDGHVLFADKAAFHQNGLGR